MHPNLAAALAVKKELSDLGVPTEACDTFGGVVQKEINKLNRGEIASVANGSENPRGAARKLLIEHAKATLASGKKGPRDAMSNGDIAEVMKHLQAINSLSGEYAQRTEAMDAKKKYEGPVKAPHPVRDRINAADQAIDKLHNSLRSLIILARSSDKVEIGFSLFCGSDAAIIDTSRAKKIEENREPIRIARDVLVGLGITCLANEVRLHADTIDALGLWKVTPIVRDILAKIENGDGITAQDLPHEGATFDVIESVPDGYGDTQYMRIKIDAPQEDLDIPF